MSVAPVARPLLRRVGARVGAALRPVYDALIGDPMRTGRFRLGGVDATAWVLSVVGLVLLGTVTVAILGVDRLRAGPLIDVGHTRGRPTFLPASLLPAMLAAMGTAWLLICTGAARGSWWLRLVAGALFLVVNAALSDPGALSVGEGAAPRVGPAVVTAGYFSVPALLALSWLVDRWARGPRAAAAARVGVAAALGAALVAFFGPLIWIHVANRRLGILETIPGFVDGAVISIEGLLTPMVFVGGVGVVAFAHAVSGAAAAPAWKARPRTAKALLAAVLLAKLWFHVVQRSADLVGAAATRPLTTAFTIVLLTALVAGTVALARALGRSDHAEPAQERITFGSGFLLGTPVLVSLVVLSLYQFVVTQIEPLASAAETLIRFPFNGLVRWGDLVLWGVAGALALRALRRGPRSDLGTEIAAGFVLVAGWVLALGIESALELPVGVDVDLLDALLTVGLAAHAVVRWRALDTHGAIRLAAIALFLWLATTEGDWLGILAGLVHLPPVVVLLVGLAFSLLAGSGFVSQESRAFPRPARPLLWAGYLLLSMSLLLWLQASNATAATAEGSRRAFVELGIPIAAWLMARRPFGPPRSASPATSPAGPRGTGRPEGAP